MVHFVFNLHTRPACRGDNYYNIVVLIKKNCCKNGNSFADVLTRLMLYSSPCHSHASKRVSISSNLKRTFSSSTGPTTENDVILTHLGHTECLLFHCFMYTGSVCLTDAVELVNTTKTAVRENQCTSLQLPLPSILDGRCI